MTSEFWSLGVLCGNRGVCLGHFGYTRKCSCCPRKALLRPSQWRAGLVAFFMWCHFYLKEQLTNDSIQSWEFSGHFLKTNQINLSLQRKQLMISIVGYSRENSNFEKFVPTAVNFTASQNLNIFLKSSEVILTNVNLGG